MALWDAVARAAGVPLATALGGAPRPIRAYASLRTMSAAAAGEEAAAAVATGFGAVKLELGRFDLPAALRILGRAAWYAPTPLRPHIPPNLPSRDPPTPLVVGTSAPGRPRRHWLLQRGATGIIGPREALDDGYSPKVGMIFGVTTL